MQLSLTYYSLGVTVSFSKFWFENDILIQVRHCHVWGIWYAFIVDMLFSSFFLILRMIRCMLIYTVKPVLTTTFLKRPPVLNDHVVVLP